LAVPGLVDEEARTVLEATNLDWHDVPIGALAEDRLGVAVTVTHDGRAGAVAEGLLGAARGCADYLLLTLGTGVGAAMVIRGRPYTGAHGIAGELGHVAVAPDGPVCACGASGCLEAIASASRIARRYSPEAVGAEEVARGALVADPVARQIWGEAIDALALAIANYVTLLDPELVVVGGGMAAVGSALFEPLQTGVRRLVRFGAPPPIVAASLGEDAGRTGAAIQAWRAAGLSDAALGGWPV
jgi:glucokinase